MPFTSGILWGDCIKCPGLSLLLWCVFSCIVAMKCNWTLIFYALSVTSASHEYLPTDTDHTFTHVVLCSGTIIWHWTCHIWSRPIKLILLTGVDSCRLRGEGRGVCFGCFCIEKALNPQAPNGGERCLVKSIWSCPTQLICLLDFYLDTFDMGKWSIFPQSSDCENGDNMRSLWECVGVFFLCLSSSIGILSGSWSLLIAGTKNDFWTHFPRYCWNPEKNEIEESAEWNWLSGEINRD